MASWRYSVIAQASETPSNVLVPRPISSRMTRLRAVALLRMLAVSVIWTMNVRWHRARLHQPGGAGRDAVSQGDEQLVLQLAGAVLGAEDLVLVLLQLGRDVALGPLDRLLADVVGRDARLVRLGDLDVVAEDLVEA